MKQFLIKSIQWVTKPLVRIQAKVAFLVVTTALLTVSYYGLFTWLERQMTNLVVEKPLVLVKTVEAKNATELKLSSQPAADTANDPK